MSALQHFIVCIVSLFLMGFGFFIYTNADADFVNKFCGAYCFVGGIVMLIVSALA